MAPTGGLESNGIHAAGLVIRDLALLHRTGVPPSRCRVPEAGRGGRHRRRRHRQLTRILREKGAQAGCIARATRLPAGSRRGGRPPLPGSQGMDLAKVSPQACIPVERGHNWALEQGRSARPRQRSTSLLRLRHQAEHPAPCCRHGGRMTVALRRLRRTECCRSGPTGCSCRTARANPERATTPSGPFKQFLEAACRCSGICLGHSCLGPPPARAPSRMRVRITHGATTGDRIRSGRVFISSQNHGFAVDESTLPSNVRATHRSWLTVLQGIRLQLTGPRQLPGPSGMRARDQRRPGTCCVSQFVESMLAMARRRRTASSSDRKLPCPSAQTLESILIIGAGPSSSARPASSTIRRQACKALREEGYRVILVNSNPATIMTDPENGGRRLHRAGQRGAPSPRDHPEKERPDALVAHHGGPGRRGSLRARPRARRRAPRSSASS